MRKTKKNYGRKTRKFYGRKTRKIYGGKFKLRRVIANTIGTLFCPYPFVKYEGECMTQAALDKKKYNNRFDGLGRSYNPETGVIEEPKLSKTNTKTKKNLRISTLSRMSHNMTKMLPTFKTNQV